MTTEAHPKLFWYSAKDSILPMKISLVEPGVSEPLWVTKVPTGPAGFNYIQIPDTVPDLVTGRRYRWTHGHRSSRAKMTEPSSKSATHPNPKPIATLEPL